MLDTDFYTQYFKLSIGKRRILVECVEEVIDKYLRVFYSIELMTSNSLAINTIIKDYAINLKLTFILTSISAKKLLQDLSI